MTLPAMNYKLPPGMNYVCLACSSEFKMHINWLNHKCKDRK